MHKYLSSQIFLKSLNFSSVPFFGLILIFVYVLAAQTSAGQAGPKFKTLRQRVWKNNPRDFMKICSGYFSIVEMNIKKDTCLIR